MSAPSHHPTPALLQAAANGELSPAVSRILAAHARLCAMCGEAMSRIECVGGAELAQEEGVDVAPDALERVLAELGDIEAPHPPVHDSLQALPREIRDIVAPTVAKIAWYTGAPGLKVLDLKLPPIAGGETFQLFRIEPGYGLPRHTHGGQEFTLVLTGAFKDERGVYRRGDISIGDESVTHRPVAEPGEICYALAVTTAPLKFKGPLGLLQRVLNFGRK
jgi:putative transcriptional regulator